VKICRLADVATIDSGAGFPLEYQGVQGEIFPFLKVSDMNIPGNERTIRTWNHSISEAVRSKLRAKAFPIGTLIFPKIGAAIGTNKKRQLSQPSCVDNNVMGVIPKPELLESEFLYFQFLAKNISDFASDSNPPSIRKSEVESWTIKVPSLVEQRSIVDILSRAEDIVRLRREADKKSAELIPSLFLDMFGDPATNPKGWPMKTVGDVIESADYGSSTKASEDGSGLPIIRMGNVDYAGTLNLADLKFVNLPDSEAEKYRLRDGDILFNRTNSKELVGKTGLWGNERDAVVASYFIRLRVERNKLHPSYLWAFMNSRHMKRVIFDTARGAIGQANINSKEIKAFMIAVPPLRLQQDFAMRLEDIRSIQSQQSTASVKAQATFNALLAQMFAAGTD
jgi:type I restriction enzyme S subunit